jgi:carbon-monoxide dehydrogenase medium subunit
MKAARFALERPRDLAEALALLGESSGVVKVLAGGQSLGPMLNLRLVEPDLVIDIAGLAELRQVGREGDTLVLGACVTHADIEDGRAPDVGTGMLARVASGIAYRAVRNRGTIGGSLAHADPAADWLSALQAFGAEVEIASRAGRRRLPLPRFVAGALSTALQPDELIVAVRVPAPSPAARFGYFKHASKVGEFAHAIGVALIDPERGAGRAVVGGADQPPLVIEDARAVFGGAIRAGFSADFDRNAAAEAVRASGVTDPVDAHIRVEALRRAVLQTAGGAPADVRAAA